MALQRFGVYACDTCGAVTMTADADVKYSFLDTPEPLGVCSIVRDTEYGKDACPGTVNFRGLTDLLV